MLGLGNSMSSGAVIASPFSPRDISGLTLWLKRGENMTADQNSVAGAVDHSTDDDNMLSGDRINYWGGYGGTSINAVQTTSGDKPRWSTATSALGSATSANGNKHFDLSSSITFARDANFTIVIRFRINDFAAARAFVGHDGSDFIRLEDENTIRVKTSGTTSDFNSGTDLTASKTQTMILVRSGETDGDINIYVRSEESSYFDTTTGVVWGSTAQDREEIVISNIMCSEDGVSEFDGNFYDVIMYNGTAVTAAQRENLFDYIEG